MSPRTSPGPPCHVCGKPSIAKKLCETHYRRLKRHGHFEVTRPADWGKRSKHPLWESWKWISRTSSVAGWPDFWDFVKDVGDRPHERSVLKRRDGDKPFGPTNWFWTTPMPESEGIQESRERKNAYMRAYFQQNPVKKKEYDLKKLYGISIAEYEQLLHEQDGKCAVCGEKDEWFNLAVDHCHQTNRVRGLLCSQCNRGIGLFKDKPDLLSRAAEYLRRPTRLI